MLHPFPPLTPPDDAGSRRARLDPSIRTILALILREMSTRYGRNPGGYVWALLEPLGAMLVLSIGFSLILRAPSLGNSFLLFYATGYLVFHLFQTVSQTVGQAINFSRPLLHYPAVTWLDTLLARFFLNTLTALVVSALLLVAILTASDTGTVVELGAIAIALTLAAALGLGIGCLNCALSCISATWTLVWGILTRPLFLASAVLYTPEDMPPNVQDILWWNPLVHIVSLMRTGFFPMYQPNTVSPLYVMSVALITLSFGLLLMRSNHWRDPT